MDVDPKQRPGYLKKGYCPSIHWTGLWCCRPAGHDEDHFAIFQRPDGMLEVGAQWQD